VLNAVGQPHNENCGRWSIASVIGGMWPTTLLGRLHDKDQFAGIHFVDSTEQSESGGEKKNSCCCRPHLDCPPMAWAILLPCIFIAECCLDEPIVTDAVLRHSRSYWLPRSWDSGLVVLQAGDPARGIVPVHIAAGMSCVPGPRHSEQGAVGVCAIHCDSHHTRKYNINSSHYRSTSRFVLWRSPCNVRALIPHMLPVTEHSNVVNAFKVTVQRTVRKLNSRVTYGLILGTGAGYCNRSFYEFYDPWKYAQIMT